MVGIVEGSTIDIGIPGRHNREMVGFVALPRGFRWPYIYASTPFIQGGLKYHPSRVWKPKTSVIVVGKQSRLVDGNKIGEARFEGAKGERAFGGSVWRTMVQPNFAHPIQISIHSPPTRAPKDLCEGLKREERAPRSIGGVTSQDVPGRLLSCPVASRTTTLAAG